MTEPLDTLAGKAFDDLYAGDIEPELRRLESRRRQTLQALALFLVAGVLLIVIEALLTRTLSHGESSIPPVGFIAITLGIAGYVGYRPLKRVGIGAKTEIITALCRPLAVTFKEHKVEPPELQRFLDARLVPQADLKTFKDMFAGQRAGLAFAFCEAVLVQGSGRRRHTVFDGLLFQIAYPRPFLGETVVLRDAGLLNRYQCPANLAKVSLDDPLLDQAFEVFGSDEVQSRALLTPDFMQGLLALERAFAGDSLRCAFVGGEVLVALEGHGRFDVGGVFTNLVERRRVVAVARSLAQLFRLMDSIARVDDA